MENTTIHVEFNGTSLNAVRGTKICELLTRVPHPRSLPPLAAIANRRLTGLYRTLTADAVVETLDYNTKQGAFVYRRSACLLLLAAVRELFPGMRMEIGQSLSHGYFIEPNGLEATDEHAARLFEKMVEMSVADIPLIITQVFVDEAASFFESLGETSKVRFLNQLPRSEVRLVSLRDHTDILHQPVCMSTGVLTHFRLQRYKHGFLLVFPDRSGRPAKPVNQDNHTLLFQTFMETRRWNELVGVRNVSDLNEACVQGSVSDLIKVCESLHEKKIAQIADRITQQEPRPKLILVAGPSASGKTTFSQRLGVQLRVNGIRPRNISMDNYYVDREKTPRHKDGSYNFESVQAVDLDLFNDHLARIIEGEVVDTPVFSFQQGKRSETKTIPIGLGENDVLILEGIHALNPLLHGSVAEKNKFGIFVSALTQLCIDEHNRIFTSDSRLLRRMVRDRLYRGYLAEATLRGWGSVRSGENKYIFPYQNRADVMFNSALVYEPAVLKPYAKRFLLEVSRHSEMFTEAERLYNFLEYFIPILSEEIPPTSVIREFIGGSTFHY